MAVFDEKIEPMRTQLHDVTGRVRSLYSNGSGGPPGFLEVARAQDNQRFEDLFKFAEQANNNDEIFKDFIKRDAAERETRKRRWDFVRQYWWKVAIFLGTVLATIAGWAYQAFVPVVKILWEDYLREHPVVEHKLSTVSQYDTNRVVADDAKIPPM